MSTITRIARSLPGSCEPVVTWEPPRRVPTGTVFRSDPEPVPGARATMLQQRELADAKRHYQTVRKFPVWKQNGDVLELTGARKPLEAAPVPDRPIAPSTHSRTKSVRVIPNGGRLKLTGQRAGEYRDTRLCAGGRGRAKLFRRTIEG